MKKWKRIIFFWTLVVLFFVITPIIILRARGYRFDAQRGVFVYSGAISIKSNPQDFDINLNGEEITSKTLNRINGSYAINGLIPGNYSISISAPGFQTWTKSTAVHSGLASEFWNVLLVRDNYTRTNYNISGINKFFISPKNDLIAYAQNSDSDLNVRILDINSKKIVNSFNIPNWQLVDTSKELNIEWSPDENYISIPVQQVSRSTKSEWRNYRYVDVTTEKTAYAFFVAGLSQNSNIKTPFSLNNFLNEPDIKDARWDPSNQGYLFFIDNGTLYRSNVTDKNDIATIATNVSSYDLSGSNIYYTQMPNELVFKTSLDGKAGATQITSSFPESPAVPTAKLIVYDDSRIAFINNNKELFIYNQGDHNTYFEKLGDDVEDIQFSNDGKKLLFWTDNQISVYFLRDWNTQPVRSENEIDDITRYSDPTSNVQWFKDYEHVIFSVGSQIKIIELDSRDHRNSMNLPQTSLNNTSAVYDGSLDKLFFTDTDTNNKSSDLYSVNFPEATPLINLSPSALGF